MPYSAGIGIFDDGYVSAWIDTNIYTRCDSLRTSLDDDCTDSIKLPLQKVIHLNHINWLKYYKIIHLLAYHFIGMVQ